MYSHDVLSAFHETGRLNFDNSSIKDVRKLDNGRVKAYFYCSNNRWFILSGSSINQFPTESFSTKYNYALSRKNYKLAIEKCSPEGVLLEDFEIYNGSESQCYSIILGTPSSRRHAEQYLHDLSAEELDKFFIERQLSTNISSFESHNPEEITGEIYIEGAVENIFVNAYERNADARKKCIEKYGCTCFLCGFDFSIKYGVLGTGIIEVHHIKPLSQIKSEYIVDPVKDLIPVCPNCHTMIHHKKPSYSIEEMQHILSKQMGSELN